MVCSGYGHCYGALVSACWYVLAVAVVRIVQKQRTVKLGVRGNTPGKKTPVHAPGIPNILPCGCRGFIPSLC